MENPVEKVASSSHISHYEAMRDKITLAQDAPEEEAEEEEEEESGDEEASFGIGNLFGAIIGLVITIIVISNVIIPTINGSGILASASNVSGGLGTSSAALMAMFGMMAIAGIALAIYQAFRLFGVA